MAPRVFHGWVVVAAAFLVLFIAYGAQYSFGVFFSALLAEFGWSRGSLSGVFSLYAFSYSLFGFAAGRMTDQWGPRVVIACGGLFLGAALAGMAFVTKIWQPYVIYGIVAAAGMSTAYVPCNTTVVKWFSRRRGLAVGLAGSGGSVGTFVLPPLAQVLVSDIGWRTAYLVFGIAIFITFWMLAATMAATWVPVFIPLVHIVPLSRDLGQSPLQAAWAVSALGIGAVAGRLAMGAISDRVGRKPAFAVALAGQVVVFVAFTGVSSVASLYAVGVLFGFTYGGVSALFPAIVADFFGRARAGAIVGFIFAVSASAGSWGPFLAGAIYDARGSYALAFLLSAALNAAALVMLAFAHAPGMPPSREPRRRA